MPGVLLGEPFAEENVPQMSAASTALYLRSLAVWVGYLINGPRDLFVEGRPTATSVKFINGPIQLSIAPAAGIGARLIKIVVLSGEGPLRSLGFDDMPLFSRKRIEL